jgi:tellurite resistance protein TehA-like permease
MSTDSMTERDKENGVDEGTNHGHDSNGRRSAFRALIQDFSPVWVTWSMNLGILASLMHELPYQFGALRIIATILYLADLVIFILCSTCMILRFCIYRKAAWTEITSDVNELCFMSCYPIAWMTITVLTSLVVSNSFWGGHAFTIVGYVMWWIAVGWVLVFGIGTYIILAQKSLTEARNLSLAVILPAVASSTAALEGGLITIGSYDMSARMAVPVIIVAFMLVGIGFFVAVSIYALFLQRILSNDWLDPIRRPTLMMLTGPAGQSASALLALSTAAKTHFPGYAKGTFLQEPAAAALSGACVLFALMMYGLGLFWMFWGIYAIVDAVIRKQTKWTPAWYGTIFPLGKSCSIRK